MTQSADFIVVGAGSAGCVVAAELVRREAGSVLLIEAGPSDAHPLVGMPFGLVWLMDGKRDWRFKSAPQTALGGRQIAIPRGRMLGGSGSINSMVWQRGRADDYDGWRVRGWSWASVAPAFEAVEARVQPSVFDGAHPLVSRLSSLFGANRDTAPTPERESAGVFKFNMKGGRRHSAADAFLRPAKALGLTVVTGKTVQRILFEGDRARLVEFVGGAHARAEKGIVLSAGSLGSPLILMNSGIGPRAELQHADVDVIQDAPGVGDNLHDHPGVGLHFDGEGYGLTLGQTIPWTMSPFQYALFKRGRLASPTVEGGLFFNARRDNRTPDIQTHVIPFKLGWQGRRYTYGEGYFADVCLCRPRSRGRLSLTSDGAQIDLGLLTDPADLADMVAGVKRLRQLLSDAGLTGTERFPGRAIASDEAIAGHIKAHCGTAYHPVGTLRMGADDDAPVSPKLAVSGTEGLWVADASVMPRVTSANTNAPSMMIGYRAAEMIAGASV
ncbi:MAG: GMC family oxidoreductase [Paracoccaceae bacterium]